MFKQCCGCKGRPVDDGPDVDDGGKKPVEEKRGSLKKDAVEKKDSLKKDVVEKKDSLKKDAVVKNDSLKKDVVEKKDSLKKDVVEKRDSLNKEAEVPMVEVVKAPESPAQVKLPETPKKSEEPQKENKKPGLTIDTNPDLDNLEEEDETVVVPITPRTAKGLTPHPTKRNSTPGLSVIPKWLSQDDDEEGGGTAEPPVTPVGRDELALRRHRFFSDLLVAAQAATEHRVRFDPLGPSVAGEPAQSSLLPSPAAELNTLLTRLENVTTRLEQATAESPGFLSHSNSSSQVTFSLPPQSAADMSSQAFEDIISGSLAAYVDLSNKIGSDVAAHAKLVSEAFQHQLQYLRLAETRTAPSAAEQAQLLQPTSQKIQDIQTLREKSRTSPFFNHLSAISESIPALGWVTVSPAPAPYIKEMNDAGQFYTNRVLKDWKQKDVTHVNWTKAWVETLTELQAFVKQKHTTGLVWAKTGSGPPPPPPGGMPPPPPVLPPLDSLSLDNSNDRSALFAEINRGEDVTKSLKKVTSDMQTHKNPGLRTGPAPFKAAAGSGGAPATTPVKAPPSNKPPVFARDGKKWLVEHQRGNKTLVVEGAEMNNVVYMYGCLDSTLTVKGKINSIFLDSCRKSAIVFDSLVSSVEFVNCQSVQMQVLGKVPTISIDKTDGCQMYLSQESMAVEIVSSKSSEMNVLVPKGNGDFAEFPIPEQYKTTVSSKGLTTTAVESAG